jgi:DNA-binding GntR family transcriptional regulator
VWVRGAIQLANHDTENGVAATRTEAVMAAIRRLMAHRALTAGEKLPSIRQFARDMQVSRRPWWKPMTGSRPKG